MYKALSLLPALAAVVAAQGLAVPQSSSSAAAGLPGCSGCIYVADVTQVIFADYTETATATAIVTQSQGRNGTVVSTTVFNQGRFSFSTGGGLISNTPVLGNYVPLTGTVFTFNGLPLTSPTAYNVFQRYTIYSLSPAGGSCTTVFGGEASAASPSSYSIVNGAADTVILDNQRQFASGIESLTCAPAGNSITTVIPVPTDQTTTTVSTTSVFRPSPIPQVSDSSISSTLSSLSTSTISIGSSSISTSSSSRTSAAVSVSTSTGVGTTSIVTFPGSPRVTQSIITGAAGTIHQPIYFSTALLGGILALPAVAAFML